MIHTRSQLIDWFQDNVHDLTTQVAMQNGSVEVLGAFNPLPTSAFGGWMVRVVSRFGTETLIAVAWDHHNFKTYWFWAPRIEWKNWIGDRYSDPLNSGDCPWLYRKWKKDDTGFDRIDRCSGVYPEENGSDSGSGDPS